MGGFLLTAGGEKVGAGEGSLGSLLYCMLQSVQKRLMHWGTVLQ
jgi:hypothetical protein